MNNYVIVRQDELNHYGVRGMKWGVRKEKEKLGLYSGRRDAINSKISTLQEKRPSFIRQRKINALKKRGEAVQKKVDKYQGKLDARKSKNEQYKERLVKKYEKRSQFGKEEAADIDSQLKDLKKYGRNSEAWRSHVKSELTNVNSIVTGLDTVTKLRTGTAFDQHIKDLKTEKKEWLDYSSEWAKNSEKMKETKVTAEMTRKDIRKSIKNG